MRNEYKTRTAEFGEVIFKAPAADQNWLGYVYLETQHGDPRQICYGGDFRGNTISATADELKSVAQKWMRDRRRWMRKEGL